MINTNRLFLLLITITAFCLQSCFEVVEQVTLHNNGSGDFQLVLNMSKSKTKINSLVKMKTVNGHPIPTKEEITKKIADIEKTLQNTSGITNVKTKLDFDSYIATLSCSFDKVSSLNAAVKNINTKEKSTNKAYEKNYEYDVVSKVFTRLDNFSLKKEYDKMSNADKEIFATANYTGIFRFDDSIANVSNGNSKIAADKKAAMLKENMLDVITDKKPIENKITLTK